LEDKKEETLRSLSKADINEFLSNQKVYTDYNILSEEFITIKPVKYDPQETKTVLFTTETRKVDKDIQTYRVLSHRFNFNGFTYMLQIGETIESVEELKSIIKKFTLLVTSPAKIV